jgi:hypothetical protein
MRPNNARQNGRTTLRQLSLMMLPQFLICFSGGQGLSAGIASVSADDFLSSLGVNTEVDQGVSGASYVQPLRYLGVHNIRDGPRNVAQMLLIHRQTGIRVNLGGARDPRIMVSIGKTMAASDALLSFEGPNEPNNFPITYNSQTGGGSGSWVAVAQYQKDLYQAIKAEPDLKDYPVFAVSEAGAETDNVGLQFLTIPPGAETTFPEGTHYADYANPHNYVTSTRKIYVDNQAWNAADPILNGPWDGLFGEYGVTWRRHFRGYSNDQLQTLPRVTTETGWDSVSDIGGEPTQGKVLLNTYLAQFKRGWRYTFLYHLRDGEGGTDHQGLFNADSAPKLAATYIHNLTTILADTRPVPSPGRLSYSITNQPSTVHDLLIQKSSGIFELVLWDENVSGSDTIALTLGSTHATVNIYDVTVGVKPMGTLRNVDALSLTLSDHAMIIEIAD